MTVNITISNLMDYIITEIFVGFWMQITDNDTLLRLPSLVALIICLFIIKPSALEEYFKESGEFDLV